MGQTSLPQFSRELNLICFLEIAVLFLSWRDDSTQDRLNPRSQRIKLTTCWTTSVSAWFLCNIYLLITNSMYKLCLHREPRSRLRRGERLRGGSTCQTSHRQEKTNGGIFVLLLIRSFVLKNENETLKPQFSHLGFFRRMSDRRLLSMRWRWEDETSKCNWKRISKLLLPWSRFLVNDEAQNDQCVLVIEPTFKVISKIQE